MSEEIIVHGFDSHDNAVEIKVPLIEIIDDEISTKFKIPNDIYFIDTRPPHIVVTEGFITETVKHGFDATPFVKVKVTLAEE